VFRMIPFASLCRTPRRAFQPSASPSRTTSGKSLRLALWTSGCILAHGRPAKKSLWNFVGRPCINMASGFLPPWSLRSARRPLLLQHCLPISEVRKSGTGTTPRVGRMTGWVAAALEKCRKRKHKVRRRRYDSTTTGLPKNHPNRC
jgi:hypothetical protein